MERDPKLVDLTGLTQKELIPILDRVGTYHGDEMLEALETAPGIESLCDDDAAYRESHLQFLRIERAKSVLAEFTQANGTKPFTVNDIIAYAIRGAMQKAGYEFDGDVIDEASDTARPMFQGYLTILMEQSLVEHIGEGVYRVRK